MMSGLCIEVCIDYIWIEEVEEICVVFDIVMFMGSIVVGLLLIDY